MEWVCGKLLVEHTLLHSVCVLENHPLVCVLDPMKGKK